MDDIKHSPETIFSMEMAGMASNAEDTASFVRNNFPLRTIQEELRKVITRKAKELALTDNETDIAFLTKVDELETVLRKKCGAQCINNWLYGNVRALKKQSALKIAFALKMHYEDAVDFLMRGCRLEGLYMRDYKDLIYRFCLNTELCYAKAQRMIEALSWLDNNTVVHLKPNTIQGKRVTAYLDEYINTIETEEQLIKFIIHYKDYLGTFRRRAHEKFMSFYNILKNTGEYPSDEEICKAISMGIPNLKGNAAIINDILKAIAENTLSHAKLSEIKEAKTIIREREPHGRITVVSRKHLILIYLLVYGGNPDFSIYPTREAAFIETINIINDDILEPCGMPLLDYRNPFDWIIFHSLSYVYFENNPDEDVVERINAVTEALFEMEDTTE